MKVAKLSRIDRCMSLLFEVQCFSRKKQKINTVDLCGSNKLDTTILIDAEKMGFITKNGNGFQFNRPINPDTVKELLDFNYNKKQEYKRKREEKLKAEVEKIQAEIWSSTPVPDVSFDEMKPQRINPITIEELITDMENLWIKLNEYAKTQKP